MLFVYIVFLFRYDMIMGGCSLNHHKLFYSGISNCHIPSTFIEQHGLNMIWAFSFSAQDLVSMNFVSVVFLWAVVIIIPWFVLFVVSWDLFSDCLQIDFNGVEQTGCMWFISVFVFAFIG